ncbi:hypothetical protein VTN77DRAFT_1342 [Rasamsonia byssochlamydoides]|uniref:uncharacterized protein n=1 Tax=Rasamsonia byssochlamydoides TaxID=89139 RepID=UPI003744A4E6
MPKTTFNIFRGSSSKEIVPDTTTRDLRPHDVFIEITHASLCGTDRLFLHNGMALGHEGAGVVRQVGEQVTALKPGDAVGLSWIRKVCGTCDQCMTDKDQYCDFKESYGSNDLDIGTFASHVVWDESMVIKLPPGLEPEYAAPLMCGGATVWGALTSHDLKPGDRVGIAGIGGLGHMAIQYASALGCDVVVLSSNASKKDEAMALGAKEFYVTEDAPREQIKRLHHLYWCGNSHPDFSKIIPLIAPGGSIYPLTVSFEPSVIPLQPLVSNGIKIQGSALASRRSIRRLLDFVVLHGIRPITMSFPLNKDGIQRAFQVLEEGRMRYRGVLVAERYLMTKPIAERQQA